MKQVSRTARKLKTWVL